MSLSPAQFPSCITKVKNVPYWWGMVLVGSLVKTHTSWGPESFGPWSVLVSPWQCVPPITERAPPGNQGRTAPTMPLSADYAPNGPKWPQNGQKKAIKVGQNWPKIAKQPKVGKKWSQMIKKWLKVVKNDKKNTKEQRKQPTMGNSCQKQSTVTQRPKVGQSSQKWARLTMEIKSDQKWPKKIWQKLPKVGKNKWLKAAKSGQKWPKTLKVAKKSTGSSQKCLILSD